ncbi:MAG: insulinase family protein, partial [Muribaculaceae bacterium]|nr:insulinase family protein [Muribaculaceae bacterium]
PDNQAIIVVGDIDVDHTEAKIKELFEGIPVDPNAPKVVDEPVPDNEQAIVVVDQDKEQQYSIAMVMFKHEAFPREMKSDMMYMMYDYMTDMVADMLNQRLKEKAQDADCPFIQAGGEDGNYLLSNNMGAFTFYALPKEGMTEQAVQAMLVEAHRAAKFGFTATEYDRARNDYMSRLEDAYNNRDKVSNESYGRAFASNYLENEPIASVEQEYEIMKQITPMVPVDIINQLLPEFISEGEKNLVVLNMNQEKEDAVYPTVEGLKGAIATAAATPIEAYVDNVKNEPLIAKLPKPGKIVKETKNNVLGFTELTLSNGVKVILKQTDFKADEIKMFADSKGGSSLYDEKDWANTELFDAVLATSGLGEFDNTELEKALAGKQASASLSLSTSYERLSGESSIKDLETMFQLTHLLMTDVRKDEKATGNLMTLLGNVLKNKSLQPEAVFSDSLNYTLGNHNWRDQPFNVEALDKVNIDRVLQIAKERTANAADFTFYFVGSFDNDTIRKHICQYIATLPASKKRENYRNVAERPVGVVTNHFTRDMETPKAIARMYWYSTTEPYSVAADVKANMVGQVLDKVYLQKIREDAGAAYSASARGGQ